MVNLPQPPSHPAHLYWKEKLLLHNSRCPVLQDGQGPWVCIPLQKFRRQFGIQPVQASKQGKDMVRHWSQSESRLLGLGVISLSLYFCQYFFFSFFSFSVFLFICISECFCITVIKLLLIDIVTWTPVKRCKQLRRKSHYPVVSRASYNSLQSVFLSAFPSPSTQPALSVFFKTESSVQALAVRKYKLCYQLSLCTFLLYTNMKPTKLTKSKDPRIQKDNIYFICNIARNFYHRKVKSLSLWLVLRSQYLKIYKQY
jgi:hypothetical protein